MFFLVCGGVSMHEDFHAECVCMCMCVCVCVCVSISKLDTYYMYDAGWLNAPEAKYNNAQEKDSDSKIDNWSHADQTRKHGG